MTYFGRSTIGNYAACPTILIKYIGPVIDNFYVELPPGSRYESYKPFITGSSCSSIVTGAATTKTPIVVALKTADDTSSIPPTTKAEAGSTAPAGATQTPSPNPAVPTITIPSVPVMQPQPTSVVSAPGNQVSEKPPVETPSPSPVVTVSPSESPAAPSVDPTPQPSTVQTTDRGPENETPPTQVIQPPPQESSPEETQRLNPPTQPSISSFPSESPAPSPNPDPSPNPITSIQPLPTISRPTTFSTVFNGQLLSPIITVPAQTAFTTVADFQSTFLTTIGGREFTASRAAIGTFAIFPAVTSLSVSTTVVETTISGTPTVITQSFTTPITIPPRTFIIDSSKTTLDTTINGVSTQIISTVTSSSLLFDPASTSKGQGEPYVTPISTFTGTRTYTTEINGSESTVTEEFKITVQGTVTPSLVPTPSAFTGAGSRLRGSIPVGLVGVGLLMAAML
ncbi:hypothetical protein ABW19_dt0210361 [Dactylella cylindrospora]|nr:hypothetical protein ABW19_dt0210361 [Dactylella cylindrospora]